MNKYFKPLDWEINDYLSYINEPSSIDLSPYLQYIIPEDFVSEDESSIEESTPSASFLTPKVELPKSKPISIPKKDTRGESKIIYTRRELNPKEFISDFTNRYIQKGVNPEVSKIIAVQNLLESRSKDTKYYSQLADQYHNYGGVKWFGSLSDPSKYVTFDSEEEENGVRSTKSSAFRVFKDRDEYVDYVIDLLKRRYDLRLDMSYTADEYLSSLMGNNKSGSKWATASNYTDTIRSMAKRLKSGGVLKLQSGTKIDRVNGDYIHQFPKLWDILTYSGISDVTGHTLDYIATMPKVDAEVLTPILLRLEDYLSRNNKISWEDLTSNEKYNLINLSSNLNKLDFSKGFTNGLDDDFRYLQGLVSRVSNDEFDSLLNMDLSPTTIKEGFQLLKNKPKSIKLLDIKRVANIFNKKYDAGLDTSLIGLKRGGRLKYTTSPNDKIDYLTEKLKKGGRIEKASLGTIFSTNEPRGQRRSSVDTSKFYYNVPIETAYTKPKTHNYKARRSYDLKQVSDSGDLYYNIIHNRTNDAKDALIRNGFTKDIDFLKQILALQSIRETGWVDRVENNNYGGYTKGEGNEKVKLTFPSAEAFWDHHINNLNSKWGKSNVRGAWYESNSLEDYINRINNPDLNTTKSDYNKYNYNRRLNGEPEQYLYAPIWDNKGRNYLDDIKEVVDRYFYYYNN